METFIPYNQILIYEEQLSMSNLDFCTWSDQAQINSAAEILLCANLCVIMMVEIIILFLVPVRDSDDGWCAPGH